MSRGRWFPLLALLFLILCPLGARAGTGTIHPGTPNRIDLSVLFTYDEKDPLAWKPMFEEASRLLYQSTQQQIQLGTIRVFVNRPEVQNNADVLINNDTAGARAYGLGLGYPGYPSTFSQVHRSTTGAAYGHLGFVHEMGHYVFGMRDEYLGDQRRRAITPDTRVLPEVTKDYFCTDDAPGGTACIMDAGTKTANRVRTFFCQPGNHLTGYVQSSALDADGLGLFFVTRQQTSQGGSCWTQLVKLMWDGWGIKITPPVGPPSDSTAGLQPITFVMGDATPRLVLAVDRTVDAAAFEEVKRSGSALLNGLRQGSQVALVSFGATARVDQDLTVLATEGDREAVRQVLDGLLPEAAPNAAMAEGMSTALGVLTGAPARSDNEVVTLLRGPVAATGTSAAQVAANMKTQRVKLNYVGLGPEVDQEALASLARQTGGGGDVAPPTGQLNEALNEEARESQGDFEVDGASYDLAPGASQTGTVLLDASAEDFSFSLEWDQGDFDLQLVDAAGNPVNPASPGVEVHESDDGLSMRVSGMPGGTWTYAIRAASGNPGALPVDFEAFASDAGTQLTVADEAVTVTFPSAHPIRASVNTEHGPILGAQVTARVHRPDGSTQDLVLFDDGAQGHGDEEAGDGTYSNLWAGYRTSGLHELVVTAVNRDGRVDQDDDAEGVPPTVEPFQREVSASFHVEGVPGAPATGSLSLAPSPVSVRAKLLQSEALDVRVLSFRLAAGPAEGVLLRELPILANAEGDLSRLRKARLYLDTTGSGTIDDDQPAMEVEIRNGVLVFPEALLVPAGKTFDVLLAIDVAGGPTAAASVPFLALAPLGLLLFLLPAGRRRAAALLLVAMFAVGGCGGGSSTSSGPAATGPSSVTVQPAVDPSRIVAVGATTGNRVTVSGQAVVGPPAVFE